MALGAKEEMKVCPNWTFRVFRCHQIRKYLSYDSRIVADSTSILSQNALALKTAALSTSTRSLHQICSVLKKRLLCADGFQPFLGASCDAVYAMMATS